MENFMTIRQYAERDWEPVLEICQHAFTPIHESFEVLLGKELFQMVYPDWKASHEKYLRSLCENESEKDRLLVAEENGIVVGFIHYELNCEGQCGKIGLNAVHPGHQQKGVATMMYRRVLDIMRTAGMKYAHVDTGGDPSHAAAQAAYEKFGFVPIPLVHYYKKL